MARLIIDTDPGVDDALALLMALRAPDTDVLAVCGVAGNVGLPLVMRNLGVILDAADARTTPVHAGSPCALLGGCADAAGFHGSDGLGDAGLQPPPEAATRVAPTHAALAINAIVRANPGAITLLALGPLTNVALAFALDPEVPRLLHRLVVMGGTIRGQGNITAFAEFNAWVDPEAFHRVLASGAPIELVSWETTLDHLVPWDTWQRWIAGDTPRTRFLRAITARHAARSRAQGDAGLLWPDPLAAAVALEPSCVLASEPRPMSVVCGDGATRGQTNVDMRRHGTPTPPNVTIVTRIDPATLERLVLDALR